jgi:hypothetical protein
MRCICARPRCVRRMGRCPLHVCSRPALSPATAAAAGCCRHQPPWPPPLHTGRRNSQRKEGVALHSRARCARSGSVAASCRCSLVLSCVSAFRLLPPHSGQRGSDEQGMGLREQARAHCAAGPCYCEEAWCSRWRHGCSSCACAVLFPQRHTQHRFQRPTPPSSRFQPTAWPRLCRLASTRTCSVQAHR